MATVILTAVGSVVGGPIGGAIGSILGQTVDRGVLFKPKGRQGPRLTELAVQTSSYGTPIPQLFGTMRVAGTVIWSTDLIETKAKSSGGKGQPSVTNFSYAASFAVLLSARPISGIGRIWADGKLLRGAGGDLKTSTGFRVHLGGEGQASDPLIVAAEGVGFTPAHRGCAYVVFEMLQLADYGNRIPSLTFEVIADPEPVAIGAIAEALSGGLIDGSAITIPLAGFAAYGDATRGVLEPLAAAGAAWFSPIGSKLRMLDSAGPALPIDDAGASAQGARGERRRRSVAPISTVPQTIIVAHYDPARDYQTGVQRARRPGASSRSDKIDLPAAIDAAAAKAMADRALARAESGRERCEIALDWRALRIVSGAIVTIAGVAGRWRAARWTLEAMVVTLDLVRLDDHAPMATTASSGRVLVNADTVHGPTIVEVFELPALDDRPLETPRLRVAAAGTSSGWRRAALLMSSDGGARWNAAGATAAAATIGALVTPVPGRPSTLRDLATIVEVELVHGGMALASADDAALDSGANLALLGDELIQFGQAEQIGVTRWRLSRMLRGRRGSEAAAGQQAIGDRFVLIEDDSLATIELPLAVPGSPVAVMASGIGDVAGPVRVDVVPSGVSVRPPSPVHVGATASGAGLSINWVRRSRAGWRWIDGVDAPLAEESEAYSVDVHQPGVGGLLRIETTQPNLTIAGDAGPSGTMITIRQRGASGESPPAILLFP